MDGSGVNRDIEIGGEPLTVEAVWRLAHGHAPTRLSKAARARVEKSAGHVEALLKRDGVIYGVTTGYGDSCTTEIPPELVTELPLHLTRFHGCGLGRHLSPEETRAVMAVRLATLVHGWSGVTWDLVTLLSDMLRLDILPLIPAEGSVGASGDLTPLSYIAGALAGEREVLFEGARMTSAQAFAKAGLNPITLKPKEALAVMNGTSIMTGLAALAFRRAEALVALSARMTSMSCLALLGNPRHFDERLFEAKPHPGQMAVAASIREDLASFRSDQPLSRLQDRYSIRCAPHVIGVLADMLPTWRAMIETEINSANDNPLFDTETGEPLHGGHFYGGHICFAMDGLKTLVANVADLLDRQFALLVDTRYNNGLPANLSGATGARASINHGLKALQIGASAWTAEALKLTMPASVFSRSTECHNQDKVSMGTIAARDALRVLELTEQVAAAHLVCTTQAVRLRVEQGSLTPALLGPQLTAHLAEMTRRIPKIVEDAPLEGTLRALCADLAAGALQADGRP
ncbi:MAG: aromatic amino acid lyase [Hyphomonadaceae bacterium]|nr:aromatic amino acid lyase [Hyphomonadaceae bacterium]